MFARNSAVDGSGTWTLSILDSIGQVGQYASLAVVNGNPAISYYDVTNLDLKYVRATDASGTSWGTPVTLDSIGAVGQYTSLAVVNGNPAISYLDVSGFDLKYVRATTANGTLVGDWGTPVTLDSTGFVGLYTSLVVVNGNPAISYRDNTNGDLKYVRATTTSGTTWGTPVTLDSIGAVGLYTSLAVVNGNPAISYYDSTNRDLKYVRAATASGTLVGDWGTPVSLDTAISSGEYTSLAVVNGNPAISYYDSTNRDLKWAVIIPPPHRDQHLTDQRHHPRRHQLDHHRHQPHRSHRRDHRRHGRHECERGRCDHHHRHHPSSSGRQRQRARHHPRRHQCGEHALHVCSALAG
jgi:hypothetical protein